MSGRKISGPEIEVSAVVLRDQARRLLLVRKRGTSRFMLPGGKPDAGESLREAAVRECAEQFGVDLNPARLQLLGHWQAPAANEHGHQVTATVFTHPVGAVGEPASEIDELRWLALDEAQLATNLAPLLIEHIVPTLRRAEAGPGRVTIFAGSASGATEAYVQSVTALGAALAQAGVGVVYGGGHVGLMGVLADATLANAGEVIGVMPQALVDQEVAHTGLSRLEVVANMHERKARMAQLGEAFIALPGGAGTLEELFEAWTWQQLGLHTKPVALYDNNGFWTPLLAMIDHMVTEGFLRPQQREGLVIADAPADLLSKLRAWRAAAPKWSQ